MIKDPHIEALADHADKYICPACGKGIEDDECDAEILWRTGEIEAIQQSKSSAQGESNANR